jgi:hypothetical protein
MKKQTFIFTSILLLNSIKILCSDGPNCFNLLPQRAQRVVASCRKKFHFNQTYPDSAKHYLETEVGRCPADQRAMFLQALNQQLQASMQLVAQSIQDNVNFEDSCVLGDYQDLRAVVVQLQRQQEKNKEI